METNSYIAIYVLYLIVLVGSANYVFQRRKNLDEMHGMMIGMTFGIIAGLTTSTFFVMPTGDFLLGVMLGTFVGLVFGMLFGKLGGHLGIMEGVIAGPMGGMMGAMLGQMTRPFDIDLFVPFFTFVFLITLGGVSYAVYCKAGCCSQKASKVSGSQNKEIDNFFVMWGAVVLVLMFVSFLLEFSIETSSDSRAVPDVQESSALQLPVGLQQFMKEEKKEAVLKQGYQEIDLSITSSKYSPNVIVAKKDVLLRINVRAEQNVGCAREIVFPDFEIDEIIPAGGVKTIQIMPVKEGTFVFRCSMDMIRGKLIVQNTNREIY